MAVSVERWRVHASWEYPGAVKNLDNLSDALADAVRETGYTGRYVYFVMEDPIIEHHYIHLPGMGRKDLEKYLRRKAGQLKSFKEEAVISYSRASSPKGGDVVLINLAPKSFVDGIVKACERLNLSPLLLVPSSSAMANKLRAVPMGKGEIVALVARAGEKLALVVGGADGSLLFDRYIAYQAEDEGELERVGREIRRSTLFSKQQFGVAVSKVVLIGAYGEVVVESLRSTLETPVEVVPEEDVSFFWTSEVIKLSPSMESNLISREIQKRPVTRIAVKLTLAMIVFLWVGVAGAVTLIEIFIRQNRASIEQVSPRVLSLRAEKEKWDIKIAKLALWEKGRAMLGEDRPPPAPGWIAGYLGDILPEGLILTKVDITRNGEGWVARLSGIARSGPAMAAKELELFEDMLKNSPYRFRITSHWKGKWIDQLKRGSASVKEGMNEFHLEARTW